MPLPLLKKLAERSQRPIGEVERLWNEAKQEAENKTRGSRGQPGIKDNRYWALVTGILKRKLNLSENLRFIDLVLIEREHIQDKHREQEQHGIRKEAPLTG